MKSCAYVSFSWSRSTPTDSQKFFPLHCGSLVVFSVSNKVETQMTKSMKSFPCVSVCLAYIGFPPTPPFLFKKPRKDPKQKKEKKKNDKGLYNKIVFRPKDSVQATFVTHSFRPLRLSYTPRVRLYRFIYYVPCDPLVPYPFLFFFFFLFSVVCLWVYIISLFVLYCSRDYNLFISCIVLLYILLGSLDVRVGWPECPIHNFLFFLLLLLLFQLWISYLTFFL